MGRRLQRQALRSFARWVAAASDERLERLMAGQVGRRIIRTARRGMRRRFHADRAGDLHAVVEFWIRHRRNGRSENWQVLIADARCDVSQDLERDPDLIVEIDDVLFLRLVTGNASAPKLFLKGDLKLDGDLLLAQQLPRLFRDSSGRSV